MTTALLLVLVGVGCFLAGWMVSRRGHDDRAQSAVAEEGGAATPQDVLEQHPIGVVIGDRLGRVEYRNEAARRLTGTHHGLLIDEAIERHLALGRDGSAGDRTIEFYGPPRMVFVISADNLSAGVASAAFIAYLSSLTNVSYSATQYALFSSMMLLAPKWLAGYSGAFVDANGYVPFFLGTAALGVPVLLLVWLATRWLPAPQAAGLSAGSPATRATRA